MTSERTISRLSRILALIPYVLGEGSVDVDEIVDRFGYSKEQLTRDLNTVFVCGLPGYGPGGSDGGLHRRRRSHHRRGRLLHPSSLG